MKIGSHSPWGTVDHSTSPRRGVHFVSTPSHGGIAVSKALAEKLLSVKALEHGHAIGGYVWFEEDCEAWVPLYEHPEWIETGMDKDQIAEAVNRYFPSYFDKD